MVDNQSRTIYTGGGDYREIDNKGNYAEGNYYDVEGNYYDVEGNYYDSSRVKQNLAQAAAEIQQLLKQLEQKYNSNDPVEQKRMAIEVIKQIDADLDWKQRLLSSVGAGGIAAFESFLNHPAASFIIAAIEKWKENSQGINYEPTDAYN